MTAHCKSVIAIEQRANNNAATSSCEALNSPFPFFTSSWPLVAFYVLSFTLADVQTTYVFNLLAAAFIFLSLCAEIF